MDVQQDLLMYQHVLNSALAAATLSVPGHEPVANASDGVDAEDDADDAELFLDYSSGLLHFATACCVVFILVGIPGNLITIIALFRCKKVRNATAVFIINLSVSDLMFCCFNLPLATSVFWQRRWRHGRLLCRLFPLLRYGLLAVSLFTVLAITINRYVMIGHPRLYPRLYRKHYLGLMVACTWMFGFGALAATWLGQWGRFGLDARVGSCSILPDAHRRSPKEFLFVVAFVIPCLAIVVCYARIFYIVRRTALRSRGGGRRATASSGGGQRQGQREGQPSSRAEDSALGSSSTWATVSGDKTSSPCTNNNKKTSAAAAASSDVVLEVSSSSGVVVGDEGGAHAAPALVSSLFRHGSRPRRCSTAPGAGSSSGSAGAVPGKMTAKDRKLLKMISVIFASFVACYLPITVSRTFPAAAAPALNIAGYVLVYLTTCINPVIYVVMSSEYRQAYKNLLLCRNHVADHVARPALTLAAAGGGLGGGRNKSQRA